MKMNDYFYNYFNLTNYESKTNEEKLKIYNKAMFDYLNSNVLVKREDFEKLFYDYYFMLNDNTQFFAQIFLLNMSILAQLVNKNVLVDYDDSLEYDEYKMDYLLKDDNFEIAINSDANICDIAVNTFFDMEEMYESMKKQITTNNYIKRLN